MLGEWTGDRPIPFITVQLSRNRFHVTTWCHYGLQLLLFGDNMKNNLGVGIGNEWRVTSPVDVRNPEEKYICQVSDEMQRTASRHNT